MGQAGGNLNVLEADEPDPDAFREGQGPTQDHTPVQEQWGQPWQQGLLMPGFGTNPPAGTSLQQVLPLQSHTCWLHVHTGPPLTAWGLGHVE